MLIDLGSKFVIVPNLEDGGRGKSPVSALDRDIFISKPFVILDLGIYPIAKLLKILD
jgi:hypothetical protein